MLAVLGIGFLGIGWTLQGVDGVSSAENAAVSISGRVVMGGGFDSEIVLPIAFLGCSEPIRGTGRRRADASAR